MTRAKAFYTLVLACLLLEEARAQRSSSAEPNPQPVEVIVPVPDESIQKRIEGVFSQVTEFKRIEVGVQSGVVTLSGEVTNSRVRDEALALARRTQGVVLTLDRIDEATEVATQLTPAIAKMKDLGKTFANKLPLIVIAILVVGTFALLGNFLYRRKTWFSRLRLSSLAENLARRLVRVVVIALGFVLALEILDATAIVGAVLGAAGIVGIALGFAFKNILENYLAGILLSTRNPFDLGDVIEIKGNTGKVSMLTSRDTLLVTLDGNHLRIPNSIIINSELLNFTREPIRRFEFMVGVSVDLDLSEARRIGLAALARNPGVLAEPKPAARVESLGDSAVNVKFLAWLDQSRHDFYKTRSESIRMVKEAFDEEGIEMPEPIYRVRLRNAGASIDTGIPKTPEKHTSRPTTEAVAVSEEDVLADRTIDKQIADDQRQSKEENLLTGSDSK